MPASSSRTTRTGSPGVAEVIGRLRVHANRRNIEGMRRYGIESARILGTPPTVLRKLAREIGRNQRLSLQLWKSGIHDARILAYLVGGLCHGGTDGAVEERIRQLGGMRYLLLQSLRQDSTGLP